MSMEPSENQADTKGLRDALDRMLTHHFERITGTRNGIHGLPLTLTTVACIVLLADREGEARREEKPAPRYDRIGLERELGEMGLGRSASLNGLLVWLQDNGYVEADSEGRFFAGKPTISMAHLLEHAFPGMPGLNLVAYFVQTLDEVQSARKPTEDALSQLDQMLRRHSSRPFRKIPPASPVRAPRAEATARTRSKPDRSPSAVAGPRFVSPIRFKSPSSGNPVPRPEPAATTPASSGEDAFSSDPGNAPLEEAQALDPIKEASHPDQEPFPDTPSEAALDPSHDPSVPEDEHGTDDPVSPEVSNTGIPPMEASRAEEAGASQPSHAAPLASPSPEAPLPSSTDQQDTLESGTEDIVEERIAAFEKKLAMQCPVCRQAFVEEKTTAKGKTYYTCTDEQCVFISWGRPHHVECPRCSNPFLVESVSPDGEVMLKCPRATCRHKQPLHAGTGEGDPKGVQPSQGGAKPRKKRVVRRKRVRRKR